MINKEDINQCVFWGIHITLKHIVINETDGHTYGFKDYLLNKIHFQRNIEGLLSNQYLKS